MDVGGIEKNLRRGASVHVDLVVDFTVGLDFDEHRRKKRRDGRRSENDLVDQIQGSGPTARGDETDIPDHGALGIQIGCPDPQPPSLFVFLGDGLHDLPVHVLDEPGETSTYGGSAIC